MNRDDELLKKAGLLKFKGFDQENPYMSEQERLEEEEALAQELSVANYAPTQSLEKAPIVDSVPEETDNSSSARDSVTNALTDTIVPRLLDETLNPKQNKELKDLYSRYKQQVDTQGQLSKDTKLRKQQYEDSLLNKEADTSLYDNMLTKYEALRGKQQEDLTSAQKRDSDIESTNYMMSAAQELNKALSGVDLGKYEGLSANEVKKLKERQGLEDKQIQEQFKISEKIKNIKDDAKTKPEDYKALFDLETSISKGKELSAGQVQNLMKMQESMNPKVKDAANTLINLLNALPKAKEKKEVSELDKAKIAKTKAETDKIKNEGKVPKKYELSNIEEKKYYENQKTAKSAQSLNYKLQEVLDDQLEYSKGTFGTGLMGSTLDLFGPLAPKTQKLKKGYNDLAIEKMKVMFEGMSKAIDSDAEQAFFKASLPNLGTNDEINIIMLLGAKAVNLRSMAERKLEEQWVKEGKDYKQFKGLPPSSVLVDPKSGKMKLVPRNKKEEILQNGSGLMTVDEYAIYKLEDQGLPTDYFNRNKKKGESK